MYKRQTYLNVILKSFWLGLLTTFICLVLGYPLALIIARCSEKIQGLLIMLVTIPMWINMLLRTCLLYTSCLPLSYMEATWKSQFR